MRTLILGLTVATCGLLPGHSITVRSQQTQVGAGRNCAAMTQLQLPDVRIETSIPVAAQVVPSSITAPHCKVSGVIGPEIRFEVLLPDNWNGRFVMGGGGGFVGNVLNQAIQSAVQQRNQRVVDRGFATAGTDTGHTGTGTPDGRWALRHIERQRNWGHVAIHRTTEVAKAIVRAYYGSAAIYSYFFGCSNGGRQALMEAQRYPDDFDGIVSGAPAFEWSAQAASFIKNTQAAFPDGRSHQSVITPDNLRLLGKTVAETCDARDGVKDGVIDDPRTCDFSLASVPMCVNGKAAAKCLTRTQRAVIERIYSPTVTPEGQIYPGQPFGGEAEDAGWRDWITGINPAPGRSPSAQYLYGTETFKYFIFSDPSWDYTRYDLSTWRRDTEMFRSLADANSENLERFQARKGKLIVYHGWADPGLNALSTIAYYGRLTAAHADVANYARLFLMPGVLHCGDGPGPDVVDWISPIGDWVERDLAPDRIIAHKLDPGGLPLRTRPLCPYPQRATYAGAGSTDDQANFICNRPQRLITGVGSQ